LCGGGKEGERGGESIENASHSLQMALMYTNVDTDVVLKCTVGSNRQAYLGPGVALVLAVVHAADARKGVQLPIHYLFSP